MGKRNPGLFDLVAVVNPPADGGVEIGDVGTVVELLPPDAVEVEFIDRDGRTRALSTLQIADLLVLNRERTQVA
jgi:catabolite regulation protein CreA